MKKVLKIDNRECLRLTQFFHRPIILILLFSRSPYRALKIISLRCSKKFNQMIMRKNFSCSFYKITMWSCESLMIVIFTREISNSENFIDISILPFGQRSLNLAKRCNRRPLDTFWGLIKYHKKNYSHEKEILDNFKCNSILKN